MFRFRDGVRLLVQLAGRYSASDTNVVQRSSRFWPETCGVHTKLPSDNKVAELSQSEPIFATAANARDFGERDQFGTLPQHFEDDYIRRKKLAGSQGNASRFDKDGSTSGTPSKSTSVRTEAEFLSDDEDDDPYESLILERPTLKEMSQKIIELVESRKIKEALNYFYEIQKLHRFKPTHHMYTRLISGCGKVGYTRMAFKLYRQMRDRNLDPTPATLTGLFNSCAEGPFKEYGLQRAHNLYERMEIKGWRPSDITYHAMIKAFGRCGDLQTAFKIMDKMQSEKHAITTETFAFLLMACISDKEAGFSLGLKVMRTMLWKKIRPSLYCYNLFLRTVRECGVGPPELFHELLESTNPRKRLAAGKKPHHKKEGKMLFIEATDVGLVEQTTDPPGTVGQSTESALIETGHGSSGDSVPPARSSAENAQNLPSVPNLLSSRLEVREDIVGLADVTQPYHRLLMCGGLKGLMDHFRDMGVRPDAKSVTLLLDCVPDTAEAELELIAEADKIGVKLDIDFFNMLIKRRAFRGHKRDAREVLTSITSRGLNPDIVTFGVLALCVHSEWGAKQFLASMRNAGLQVNEEILGTLIVNACFKWDFSFLLSLMKFARNEEVKISVTALKHIEKAKQKARKALMDKERGREVKFAPESLEKGYTEFCLYYEEWLKLVGVDAPQHPWQQYWPENAKKSRKELVEEAEKEEKLSDAGA